MESQGLFLKWNLNSNAGQRVRSTGAPQKNWMPWKKIDSWKKWKRKIKRRSFINKARRYVSLNGNELEDKWVEKTSWVLEIE